MKKPLSAFISIIIFFSQANQTLAANPLQAEDYCHFIDANKGTANYDNDNTFFQNFVFAFYPIPYKAEQMKYENPFLQELGIRAEELGDEFEDAAETLSMMVQDFTLFFSDATKTFTDALNKWNNMFKEASTKLNINSISNQDEFNKNMQAFIIVMETISEFIEEFIEDLNFIYYEARSIVFWVITAFNDLYLVIHKLYVVDEFLKDFSKTSHWTSKDINETWGSEGDFAGLMRNLAGKTASASALGISEILHGSSAFYKNEDITAEIPIYKINAINLTNASDYSLLKPIIKARLKSFKKYKKKPETDFFFYEQKYAIKLESVNNIFNDFAANNDDVTHINITAGTTNQPISKSDIFKYNGISKYNDAIPSDINLTLPLIKNINQYLLAYVDIAIALGELDIKLYSNPHLTKSSIKMIIEQLSQDKKFNDLYDQKIMINDIKKAVKASEKIKTLFKILDKSLNKIHNQIISQRKDQLKYRTAMKDVIKNSFLAKENCENLVEEVNNLITTYDNSTNQEAVKAKIQKKIEGLLKSSNYKKILSSTNQSQKAFSKLCEIDSAKFGSNLYSRSNEAVSTPQKEEIEIIYNKLNRFLNISSDSYDNNCSLFKYTETFTFPSDVTLIDEETPEVENYPNAMKDLYNAIKDTAKNL
ncbi:hypothetical protein N9C35_05140 [Flavobacteriaceae bacterium]|nr:hypothetical protein [Flavobacteriaceae bacterium]